MPLPLFVPEGRYQLLPAASTRKSFSAAAPGLRWFNSEPALPGFAPPAAQQPWGTARQTLLKGRRPEGSKPAGFPRVAQAGGRGRERKAKEGKEGQEGPPPPGCGSSPPRPADARWKRRQRHRRRGHRRAAVSAGGDGPLGARGGAGARVPPALLPAEGPGEECATATLFRFFFFFFNIYFRALRFDPIRAPPPGVTAALPQALRWGGAHAPPASSSHLPKDAGAPPGLEIRRETSYSVFSSPPLP